MNMVDDDSDEPKPSCELAESDCIPCKSERHQMECCKTHCLACHYECRDEEDNEK